MNIKIKSALISVFDKTGLDDLVKTLHQNNVKLYSTGGTQQFIESLQVPCISIESVTGYPSILGGRVKTLHPKVFGGILARRENQEDLKEIAEFEIPLFDLVIVDLYPFEKTVATSADENQIIEKIDIGGVSLIRAAAKNYSYTSIVAQKSDIDIFLKYYQQSEISLEARKLLASNAFKVTSGYDNAIQNWLFGNKSYTLRYGENPHQEGTFIGNLEKAFTKLGGKELSYNNLLDVDAALSLLNEFDSAEEATFVIIKHNNACGVASRETIEQAWKDALSCDPVSAFGGILASNKKITATVAKEIDSLFFEVLCAPEYDADALEILLAKKNRIILKIGEIVWNTKTTRTILNGILVQDRDAVTELGAQMKTVTKTAPSVAQITDLEFALKIAKNTKSNTIVLAKNKQLLASGTGQTSRVDALKQAIEKANRFNFELEGAAMASDAFFPFPDCVEIADKAGIRAVVQPGGSIKDAESIKYCDENGLAMVITGVRHFKH